MITPEDARTLFAYDAWANRRMLDACAALAPRAIYARPGVEFSFRAGHDGAHPRRTVDLARTLSRPLASLRC